MFYLLNTITKPKYMRTIGTSLDFRCIENCPFTIFTIDTSSLSTTTSCCSMLSFLTEPSKLLLQCVLYSRHRILSHTTHVWCSLSPRATKQRRKYFHFHTTNTFLSVENFENQFCVCYIYHLGTRYLFTWPQ